MRKQSGGMHSSRVAAEFALMARGWRMGSLIKARIMEAYLRLPI